MLNSYLFLECAEKMSVQKFMWQCSPYNLYKLQIQDSIIEKIVSLQVKSLPDLLQSSTIIGSAIQETETVSVKSLVSKINVLCEEEMNRKGDSPFLVSLNISALT